jgi:hypothetical protein
MADSSVFDDTTAHYLFKWSTDHPKLAKAIKTKVGELMGEAHWLHKTAVKWHDTQFVDTGVIMAFKRPSAHRTTYAWLYRTLVPVMAAMGFTKDDWQWAAVVEAVDDEGDRGFDPSPTDGASCQPPSGRGLEPDEASSPKDFPASVALKIRRGIQLGVMCGWAGAGPLFDDFCMAPDRPEVKHTMVCSGSPRGTVQQKGQQHKQQQQQ